MVLHDISLPINNSMWSYRSEWKNSIQELIHTNRGDSGTVYKFNLYSHTGTYIETSQHKLNNSITLDKFLLTDFYRIAKVIIIEEVTSDNIITLNDFLSSLSKAQLSIDKNDSLIIASGYGKNYSRKDYLTNSPSFELALTNWIIDKKIALLGVDTPIMDSISHPYHPVNKLFVSNEKMLLLAPLKIDTAIIKSGTYLLSCLPIPIENVSGCQCRAILVKN